MLSSSTTANELDQIHAASTKVKRIYKVFSLTKMPQGLSRRSSREMSYDEFVDTYGPLPPAADAKAAPANRTGQQQRSVMSKKPSIKKGLTAAAKGLGSADLGGQMEKSNLKPRNNSNSKLKKTSPKKPMRAILPAGAQASDAHDMTSPGPDDVTNQRRNSKVQNIASRITRRSFRNGKRKGSDSSAPNKSKPSSRPPTPTRFKAFFKRSHSVNRDSSPKSNAVKLQEKDNNHVFFGQSSTDPPKERLKMKRSSSYSTLTSPALRVESDASKRYSAFIPVACREIATDGKDFVPVAARPTPDAEPDILAQLLEQKRQILEEQERFRLRFPDAPTSLKSSPNSPEKLITKKYQQVRENEEMRVVAVVSLLSRRKNSLKIKCDQFEKDLSAISDERGRALQRKLRNMRQKLAVVEQCIQEQRDLMKVTVAKTELMCCIDLFRLGLRKEEELLLRNGRRRETANESDAKISATLVSSTSCETLGSSFDDASVFGGSSASLLSLNSSPEPSPPATIDRLFSATNRKTVSVNSNQNNGKKTLVKQQSSESAGVARSSDCILTSDCDSGVDNGDTTSRSDVGAECALSKSTNSIASSSYSTRPNSVASCIRLTPSPPSDRQRPGNVFFSSCDGSTIDTYALRKHAYDDATGSRASREKRREVDPSLLAQIEDFETFAEKTIRCRSHKGKLVRLKPGT